jgi:hypothetical protein
VRLEWNTELSRGDMDHVDKLLAIIAAHKEIGVTGASVMFSFFKRRIQPIQQRHTIGFKYIGAEDPSQMCAEELTDDAALIRVKQVLLDMNAVPYIPELFSAQNLPRNFRAPPSPPLTSPKLAESLRPFSAASEQLVANRSRNGAQEIQREGWKGERVAAAIWGVDLQ